MLVDVPAVTAILTAIFGSADYMVRAASGDVPRASYEELVPDITLYFPTEEDIRLIESTSIGLFG